MLAFIKVDELSIMSAGTIQISGETLSIVEVENIKDNLRKHLISLLSLRNCKLDADGFRKLMRAVCKTKSLLQLNLNIGVVDSDDRAILLANALNINRSIQSLYLHGTPLGDTRFSLMYRALSLHPSLVDLDVGDCMLGDNGIRMLCYLLAPDGAKSGLKELVLSANTRVTNNGWAFFFCSLAASSCLRSLNLDYNPAISDSGAKMLAVVVAGTRSLKKIDLEACNLTEDSAKVWLEMLQSFPTPLRALNITENKISTTTMREINECLTHDSSSDDG
nr:leucine-rich repeat-containing protein 73 isoform X1 [Ciona intestinalis]|eukprot:XP_026691771.1 leucine-rich repeat-containing protein 73 isoform X1 [Ciona intestinalis]